MAYGVRELEDGAAAQDGVSVTADRAVTVLSQLPLVPGAFGTVPSAAVFGGALDRARLGHGRRIAAEVTARSDLSQRLMQVSGTGLALLGSRRTSRPAPSSRHGPMTFTMADVIAEAGVGSPWELAAQVPVDSGPVTELGAGFTAATHGRQRRPPAGRTS